MRVSLLLVAAVTWAGLWHTPDQLGAYYFQNQEYAQAAEAFEDQNWVGAAWYRAGEFEKSAQAYSRCDGAQARFNEGNAWLMRGKYDLAIDRYQRALKERPKWKKASENLALAIARSKKLDSQGGDLGDQRLGADKIVFDKKKDGGNETTVSQEQAVSDTSVQALWLRRVQTKPADFLRSKFAYQYSLESDGGTQ